MLSGLNDAARNELEDLRVKAGGSLLPVDIVERARSENSALHRYFEWSDTEAAEAYRLNQARGVIRAVVRFVPSNVGTQEVRAYLSLPSDRATTGGYRAVTDVIDDAAMLDEAIKEITRWIARMQARYSAFDQLRPVLADMAERVSAARQAAE
jgi:hypothetical protein